MMLRRVIRFAVISACLVLLISGLLPAADRVWKAGTASSDITPTKPLWLAGYSARTRPAEATLQPIWIKALVLETPAGDRAVLLTSDLLGLPKELSDRLAASLWDKYRIDRSRVMLTASHTHSGPVLSGALVDIYRMDQAQWALVNEYSSRLEAKIVDTIGQALSHLEPARIYAGLGRTGFAVNRRNNREADVPGLLEKGSALKGPVDHSVPVLAIRNSKGELTAVLFSYACHATTLDSYLWSGDYPGVAQQVLETDHPGIVAMFHAGCGADQNPIPRKSIALCEKYGAMLASAVEDVLQGDMDPLPPQLQVSFRLLDLDYERNPTRDELQQIESDPGASFYRKRWAARVRNSIEAGERLGRSHPYPVEVWLLGGRQLWIALGGEVVVDYSLRFKREFGSDTWVTAYANGVMAYIPSSRIQEEGGYESSSMDVYGLPGIGWARDIENRISDAVSELVREVRGKK